MAILSVPFCPIPFCPVTMWIWRIMERISWMEHRTNEKILQMVDEKITYRINPKSTEKLAGPHNESLSLLRTIIEGRMEEKKKKGRPRMMLLDWTMKEDYSKLKERAGHRG